MTAPRLIQNFSGGRALLIIGAAGPVGSLESTLHKLGLSVEYLQPCDGRAELGASGLHPDRDVLFVDGDLASPLDLGLAPMSMPVVPIIGLVGVEAPSRLKALMTLGATAFLRKPVHGATVYSALFMGVNEFLRRRHLETRLAEGERRRHGRRFVIKAILRVMEAEGIDDEAAYQRLRRGSMAARQTLEEFCRAVLARSRPTPEPHPAGTAGAELNEERSNSQRRRS